MTPADVVVYALARCAELGASVPVTQSLLYRQVGVRQQQLYARAAAINPEWAGVCATASLSDGAADLAQITDPLDAPERIQRITIADPGTSAYAANTEVHPVPLSDQDYAAFPPRVTVRDRVLRGVGTDLDGVVSLRVSYARLPLPIAPDDGDAALALPEPHTELLVVDLARYALRKATNLTAEARAALVTELTTEEAGLLAAFDQYVRDYVGPLVTRFGGGTAPRAGDAT